MFSSEQFWAFLLASVVIAVTPGPGVLYLVTRTVAQGRSAGFLSVWGVALGNLASAILAAVGVAALLSTSPQALRVMRYAGAAYLILLGVLAFVRKEQESADKAAPVSSWANLRDGFLVAALNPKTALFFAAFLPQFMTPERNPVLQGLLLGAMFVLIAACSDCGYVLLASALQSRLSSNSDTRRWLAIIQSLVFITLGLLAAFWV